MQRKRGELGPFGETFNHLNGSGKAIREASPQSLHHFTQADQVNHVRSKYSADPQVSIVQQVVTVTANRSQPWLSPNVFPLCV